MIAGTAPSQSVARIFTSKDQGAAYLFVDEPCTGSRTSRDMRKLTSLARVGIVQVIDDIGFPAGCVGP